MSECVECFAHVKCYCDCAFWWFVLTLNSHIDYISVECLECSFPIIFDHHWLYSVSMSGV